MTAYFTYIHVQTYFCPYSGISNQEYDNAVNEGRELEFTCMRCRYEESMETDTEEQSMETSDGETLSLAEVTVNYSDLALPERESTRISIASMILQEETDQNTSVDDTRTFDITRPERSMVVDEAEVSLEDNTVTEVLPDAEVTYEIIERGTERGKPKLVSSDGYAYVVNRTFPSGTVDWRCSVRRKGLSCSATVKQTGDSFRASSSGHCHPAKPGLNVAVQVKQKVS